MSKVWTMSEAAGASARAIRQAADATLADVAKAARGAGLPWSTGRVGDFESGRTAPSLPTLIAFAGALSEVVQEKAIGLPDLFSVDGDVQINDTLILNTERLREVLRGSGFQIILSDLTETEQSKWLESLADAKERFLSTLHTIPEHMRPPISQIAAVHRDFAEGDERLARSLGISSFTAAATMAIEWGKTYVQRRDELAGPEANAQKKGIVARQLKADLKNLIVLLDL